MRNFNLILLSFSLALNLHAQDIELTFTGSGESATVEGVKVVCLSKGDTIDISGTDVLKLVSIPSVIHYPLPDDQGLMIFPNSVRDKSRIMFRLRVIIQTGGIRPGNLGKGLK